MAFVLSDVVFDISGTVIDGRSRVFDTVYMVIVG